MTNYTISFFKGENKNDEEGSERKEQELDRQTRFDFFFFPFSISGSRGGRGRKPSLSPTK